MVNDNFKGKKVAATLIGNSIYEGGGDAKKIYTIIGETCDDIDLYIYDYIQEDYFEEKKRLFNEIVTERKEEKITRGEYEDKMKRLLWEENFGKYLYPVPELSLYEVKKMIKRLNSV